MSARLSQPAHTPGPLRTGLPGALYALEVIRDMLAGQGLEQQAQAVAAQALARLTPEADTTPDLLAALRDMLASTTSPGYPNTPTKWPDASVVVRARAALAKVSP